MRLVRAGVLAALLSACAGSSIERTAHRVEAIPRTERITVAWDIHRPETEGLVVAMRERGMLDGAFDRCTSAQIEDAFRAHGYAVNVAASPTGALILAGDTRYVLRLQSSAIRTLVRPRASGPRAAFGPVEAEMQVQLARPRAGRPLWTGQFVLSSDPAANAAALRKLVNALNEDGYLGGENGEKGQAAVTYCPASSVP